MKLHSTILGEGTPLLILHGFLGMSDNWKTLGREFSKEGFQVHLIDQRNHGRSPHSEEFNYTLMAKDIHEYCHDHALEKCVLLGHSMGGKVAMLAASQFPNLLEKLIVVDIAPKYYAPHHQQILEGLKALDDANLSSRGEAEELLSNYIADPGVKLFLLKNLYWKTKEKLALRLNLDALLKNIEAVGEALPQGASLNKPALFIKGEKSEYINKIDEALIKEHFPKAQIISIPNAGHWVHAEDKKAFFTAVMQFL
jgi:esterase